jgi:DNA repair exonuclease SbcCD ATPase subunit
MFQELQLTNFRQHTDLTINFTGGVNAIRGANEKGKTTILEAIAYALFGATSLREALAEVVTYGQKSSTLKVRLDFNLNGVDYRVTRSEKGAEIKDGTQILATGQGEVKRYIEKLIGASANTASLLMLANQQSIRGALDPKKSGAAIELIETLANFSLIDQIITLAQGTLPTGTTVAVKARLQTLEQQLAVPVEDDTGPLTAAWVHAAVLQEAAQIDADLAKQAWAVVEQPAQAASQRNMQREQLTQQVRLKSDLLEGAQRNLTLIKPVPGPSSGVIAELRKLVEDASRSENAKRARAALTRLVVPDNEWEGDYDSLLAEQDRVALVLTEMAKLRGTRMQTLAVLNSKLITETHCGLCGKDLAAVPEVVTKNAATQVKIDALKADLVEADAAWDDLSLNKAALDQIVRAHQTNMRVFQDALGFVTLDHGYGPPRYTWTGPEATTVAGNPILILQGAEAQVATYQRDLGRHQQAEKAVTYAKEAHGAAVAALALAEATFEIDKAILEASAEKTRLLYAAESVVREQAAVVSAALGALNQAKAVLRERQGARSLLEGQLVAAQQELKEMDFNNALITRVREVRPEIADELWGMVLTAVSTDFSAVRGRLSKVSRSDNAFKVDGQGIGGLSGSTLDALGLAIRKSLTRVFLPNTGFMMLDEPAAAADPDREANMLGLIATSEFDQVLLITHSDIADSFAANVIQL